MNQEHTAQKSRHELGSEVAKAMLGFIFFRVLKTNQNTARGIIAAVFEGFARTGTDMPTGTGRLEIGCARCKWGESGWAPGCLGSLTLGSAPRACCPAPASLSWGAGRGSSAAQRHRLSATAMACGPAWHGARHGGEGGPGGGGALADVVAHTVAVVGSIVGHE